MIIPSVCVTAWIFGSDVLHLPENILVYICICLSVSIYLSSSSIVGHGSIVGQFAVLSQYKDFATASFHLFYLIVMTAKKVIPKLRTLGPYYSILLSLWIVQDWKYYGSYFPWYFFLIIIAIKEKNLSKELSHDKNTF